MATKRKKSRKAAKRRKPVKGNPPLRKVGAHGTGWIDARRVKIVRRGKKTTVLVEKGAKRRR
jgi:hypothetical protein